MFQTAFDKLKKTDQQELQNAAAKSAQTQQVDRDYAYHMIGNMPEGAKSSASSANLPKTTKTYTVNAGNQPYVDQLNSLYDQIMNRKPFQYDLNGDLLYRQMADQYTQLGQQAMRDTIGQAAALTGGYGNSYAQSVGNQAYQQYLTALNEQVPSLYDRALNAYMTQGDQLLQQYQLAAAHPEYVNAIKPRTYTVAEETPRVVSQVLNAYNQYAAENPYAGYVYKKEEDKKHTSGK